MDNESVAIYRALLSEALEPLSEPQGDAGGAAIGGAIVGGLLGAGLIALTGGLGLAVMGTAIGIGSGTVGTIGAVAGGSIAAFCEDDRLSHLRKEYRYRSERREAFIDASSDLLEGVMEQFGLTALTTRQVQVAAVATINHGRVQGLRPILVTCIQTA